ncbi:ABC transporter substrate binding protein [Chloroflexota bacterium]
MTGISDWLDIPTQIQMVLDIMPDLKTIGTVYNAGETNAVVQVEALKQAAPGLGIQDVVRGYRRHNSGCADGSPVSRRAR